MDEKRIVEINGIKMEVDMRTARRVDTFKVGDNVKVLGKTYNDQHEIKPGIIVDFAMFKELPTIVVAVFNEGGWSSTPSISFEHINSESNKEIIFATEEEIRLSREGVVEKFEREIQRKKNEWQDLQNQLAYFKKHFLQSEGQVLEVEPEADCNV